MFFNVKVLLNVLTLYIESVSPDSWTKQSKLPGLKSSYLLPRANFFWLHSTRFFVFWPFLYFPESYFCSIVVVVEFCAEITTRSRTEKPLEHTHTHSVARTQYRFRLISQTTNSVVFLQTVFVFVSVWVIIIRRRVLRGWRV